MKLVPFGDQVVVQSPKQPENKAGIEMSRASAERPLMGTVLAVGPGVKEVKIGDLVAYTRFNINEVELDTELFYLMEEKQVLTKIEG